MAGILLATASYDRHIKLWRVNPPEQYCSINFAPNNESQVNCLCVSSNAKLLAAAGYQTVKVYELADDTSGVHPPPQPIATCAEHGSNITAMGFIHAGQPPAAGTAPPPQLLYTASEDGTWRLWEVRQPALKCLRSVDVKEPLNTAALLHNHLLVVGTQLGSLGLWALDPTRLTTTADASGAAAAAAVPPATSPGACGSQRNPDGLLDSVVVQGEDPAVRTVAVPPHGGVIAAGTNTGRILVFGVCLGGSSAGTTSSTAAAAAAPTEPSTHHGAPSPSSDTPAPGEENREGGGAAEGEATTTTTTGSGVGAATTKPRPTNESLTAPSTAADTTNASIALTATSTGGELPVSSSPKPSDRSGYVQHNNGRGVLTLVWTFSAHPRYVLKCAFSLNGARFCTTSADSSVKVWDVPREDLPRLVEDAGTHEELRTDEWHPVRTIPGQRWVWDCVFTETGEYLVTASSDHLARLWQVDKGTLETTFTGHQKPVTCAVLATRG